MGKGRMLNKMNSPTSSMNHSAILQRYGKWFLTMRWVTFEWVTSHPLLSPSLLPSSFSRFRYVTTDAGSEGLWCNACAIRYFLPCIPYFCGWSPNHNHTKVRISNNAGLSITHINSSSWLKTIFFAAQEMESWSCCRWTSTAPWNPSLWRWP